MVKKMHSSSSSDNSSSKSNDSTSTGKTKGAGGLLDSQLASSVKESAQQIWLAGMGAFAKAQEEGGKVFDALVKEGMSLQKKTQGMAEDKISEVGGKMSAMADTVSAKAGQNWDKLEAIFEQRTAQAMSKLGVPTSKDVDALARRVDALEAASAKAPRTAGTATRATKSAAKTASPVAGKTKTAVKSAAKTVANVANTAGAAAKAPAKRARKTAPA